VVRGPGGAILIDVEPSNTGVEYMGPLTRLMEAGFAREAAKAALSQARLCVCVCVCVCVRACVRVRDDATRLVSIATARQ
jgi:hypothetical protein